MVIYQVMYKAKAIIAVIVVVTMIFSSAAIVEASMNSTTGVTNAGNAQSTNFIGTSFGTTNNPWSMPTTTMEEPGYTNGTFNCGISCGIGDINPMTGISEGDIFIYQWIYSSLFITMSNQQIKPWLATGYTTQKATSGDQTFDIETNSMVNYSCIYVVHLRPYVQWTDWSAKNASQTYLFSNTTCFYSNGVKEFHTYHSFKSTVMKKYYLQSADVALSWRLESSLGTWPDVVNVVPDGNLSVKVYVSRPALLILSASLQNYILPYHIWVHHDFTSQIGLFNCTPGISSGSGFYSWNLGWDTGTGSAPGLVGNGPFMITNNYGLPEGRLVPNREETYYVNPHYFTQYANESSGLRQYTPKFYELYVPYYSSLSSEVAAFTKGQMDMLSFEPEFLSLIQSTPGAYVYHEPSCCFCAIRLNENYTPLNITKFRQALAYASPYQYIDSVIMGGYGTPSSNDIPPTNVLWDNTSTPEYTYNIHKAESIISGIKGMDNTSSGLLYDQKPVCLQFQVLPGSQVPCALEKIEAVAKSFNSIGIKTSIIEVSCSTVIANVFETVSGQGNFYQIANFGQGTATGNPALKCAYYVNTNPSYFGIGCNLGPFTSISLNGINLTGSQVQTKLNQMSSELINCTNLNKGVKISMLMQTIVAEEVPWINLGFRTNFIAYQDNQYTNFTTQSSKSQYSTFFTLLEVYKKTVSVKSNLVYRLSITGSLNGSLVESQGDSGSICYTVMNETSHIPIPGATVAVTVIAPDGGLSNITSNTLTTNSDGKALWKYEVYPELNKLLVGCNAECNIINLPEENVNITAHANAPTAQHGTRGNSTYQKIILINTGMTNYLKLEQVYNGKSHLYSGGSGSIMYKVINSTGATVQDANISVAVSSIGNTLIGNAFVFNTSTGNRGYFNFSINSLLPSIMKYYNSQGEPINIYYQELNISAVAWVGNQDQTGPAENSSNYFVINPSLDLSYQLNSTKLTSGGKYSINFKVTENGTSVSGVRLNLKVIKSLDLNFSKGEINLVTNSSGEATFYFNLTNYNGTTSINNGEYVEFNQTFTVTANDSNSTIQSARANLTFQTFLKVEKGGSNPYVLIGILIGAVALIGVASTLFVRKRKTNKNSNTGKN